MAQAAANRFHGLSPRLVQTISTIRELREALEPDRRAGARVGLVPTMGFLHHGHMALVGRAKAENDRVVLSIFVNPTQFAPHEDFATYPRDLDRDLSLCGQHGVDLVFAPSVEEMYPQPMDAFVEVASLSPILIGQQRPTHFRGVSTVVAKLLNIVEPDRAYFGEKDFQQLAVIRRMARDLSMRAAIVGVPTVREPDGLAASSRNIRLSPDARRAAPAIAHGLDAAQARFASGERSADVLAGTVREAIAAEPALALASLDIRDSATLDTVETVGERTVVILVSVKAGAVSLIDQRELGSIETRTGNP